MLRQFPDRMKIVPFPELEACFKGATILGEGGFGIVCQVNFKGEELAVKKLNMSRMNNQIGDFIREIVVLATLNHPNIVQLRGVSCSETHRCLMYELMAGGSLADRIMLSDPEAMAEQFDVQWGPDDLPEAIPCDWKDRLPALIDACIGLACLHECTLLHCDIKPENILIRENGRAAVADFGLSRSQGSADSGGCMGYSPGFADPYWAEVRKYTCASDVYAMGVCIQHILTGIAAVDLQGVMDDIIKRKRPNSEKATYLTSHLQACAEWPEDVAHRLAELAVACAEFHIDDRPTIYEMLDAFTEIARLEVCKECTLLDDIRRTKDNKPVREDAKDWGSKLRQSLEEFESGRRQHEKDKTKQKKVAAANALLQRKEMIAKAEAETAVQPETVSVAAPKLTPSSSKVTTTTTTTIQAVDFPSIPKLTREQSSLAMLAKRNLIQQSVTRVSLDRTSSREIPDDF